MSSPRSLSKLAAASLVVGASCLVQRGSNYDASYSNCSPALSTLLGNVGRPVDYTFLQTRGGQKFMKGEALHASRESETAVNMTQEQMAASYSLLWSPGFLAKFSLSAVLLTAMHTLGMNRWVGGLSIAPILQRTSFLGFVPNLLLPLLSSSCCLLQLAINALVGAGGCAGFNTVLGPVRPFFLSTLAYLNWLAWPPPLGQGLLRLSLAFLPEVIDVWNRILLLWWKKKTEEGANSAKILVVLEIDIPSMGCVACINKIDGAIRQSAPSQIVDAKSWLDPNKPKGGGATIQCAVDSMGELNDVRDSILSTIERSGFSDSVILKESLVEDAIPR